MQPADVVLRFLESVGRRSEAEFYVQLFRSEPKERFATLSVDSNVARYATDSVVLHLRFLYDLGLYPVVVLGLFEPTEAHEHAARINRRLAREQVQAELVSPHDPSLLQKRCVALTRSGIIPIVAFGTGQGATTADRVVALGALLNSLKTRKLLFLHRPGGLRQQGVLVPNVNLTKDYAALSTSKDLSRKERAILQQSRRIILELVEHRLTASVTSPLNLMRELFTVKGAGTLLRKGSLVTRYPSLQSVEKERLKSLLTRSFGRPPTDEFFTREVLALFLEENFRGAAIIAPTPIAPYLTKFAVGQEAQGEGIGRDLWDAFIAEYPTIFWRARPNNPIGEWYSKQADGLCRFRDWIVYWKGLETHRISDAIAWAMAQPIDLPPLPPSVSP